MKIVIDAQQKQIDYETILQTIAKDGLIYGLGVGKTRWSYETRMQTTIVPSFDNPELFVKAPPAEDGHLRRRGRRARGPVRLHVGSDRRLDADTSSG